MSDKWHDALKLVQSVEAGRRNQFETSVKISRDLLSGVVSILASRDFDAPRKVFFYSVTEQGNSYNCVQIFLKEKRMFGLYPRPSVLSSTQLQ